MPRKLTLATCQYPVSDSIPKNTRYIIKQISGAKFRKADIVHFSECNLTGYAGIDFHSFDVQNEEIINDSMGRICTLAGELGIWLILGRHSYDKNKDKPYISLFIIDDHGNIVVRYDKRMLFGEKGQMDKRFYESGEKAVVFDIKNVRCGLLICHEWRYPELYREYKKLGVELIFHSWYDGNLSGKEYESDGKNTGELILGSVRGYAANNHLWISGSNTSRRESCFPAFVVRPDGRILNKLSRNRAGVLISRINPDKKYEDPSGSNREKILSSYDPD